MSKYDTVETYTHQNVDWRELHYQISLVMDAFHQLRHFQIHLVSSVGGEFEKFGGVLVK